MKRVLCVNQLILSGWFLLNAILIPDNTDLNLVHNENKTTMNAHTFHKNFKLLNERTNSLFLAIWVHQMKLLAKTHLSSTWFAILKTKNSVLRCSNSNVLHLNSQKIIISFLSQWKLPDIHSQKAFSLHEMKMKIKFANVLNPNRKKLVHLLNRICKCRNENEKKKSVWLFQWHS